MNKKEILDKMLDQNDGMLLTRDVVSAGISKTYFMDYVKKMDLERVAMGAYLSPDAWRDYFYLLQVRYPEVQDWYGRQQSDLRPVKAFM